MFCSVLFSAMFLVIFKTRWAHNISFVQHFTRTHLYLERHNEICAKTYLEGTLHFVCVPSFLVCAHLTGILPHSLPEWAFRARPGLWRICLCPKVARIAEHKFRSRYG